MKQPKKKYPQAGREKEKGAALVTVLLITLVLSVACAGLLLESSMNTMNVTDAVAEQQAYVAAESGIQSTINVLRGNVKPSPLFDTANPDSKANKINFLKALDPKFSNLATDKKSDGTLMPPRLSRWLGYNYTPAGGTVADRVTMPLTGYSPRNGFAYNITLSDPDNTGTSVGFNTVGIINRTGSTAVVDGITFTFLPKPQNTLDISSGVVTTSLGKLTYAGIGTLTQDVTFDIVVQMTDPYELTRVVRGYIPKGTAINSTNPLQKINIYYIAPIYVTMGSVLTLSGIQTDSSTTPPKYYIPSGALSDITATLTPIEPQRVLITSTGYGPRGAQKKLEAIVQKNFFDGLTAPATLTLVGSSSGFVFKPGNSSQVTYSGDDVVSNVILPSVGSTNQPNLDAINQGFADANWKANVYGAPADVNVEIPTWLSSPANLNVQIERFKTIAKSSQRYFPESDPDPTTFGDYAKSRGITFVEGDLDIKGNTNGGGILIVTGKLTLKGNISFRGLIVVIGEGGVAREGGGGGTLEGNMIVAPYDKTDLTKPFLAPKYDMDGGGNSTLVYNSDSTANGLEAVSNFVLGVVEK